MGIFFFLKASFILLRMSSNMLLGHQLVDIIHINKIRQKVNLGAGCNSRFTVVYSCTYCCFI